MSGGLESGGSAEAGGISVAQTGINSNYVGSTPWGFGEGYTDPTGLVYLVHRYYDPATGQFLSVDPDRALTDDNYQYTSDNPIEFTDPLGTHPAGFPLALLGAGSGAASDAETPLANGINGSDTANWALANLTGTNNGYGDDCTDFVSRALHFGGGDAENWGPDPPLDHANDDYWYRGQIAGWPVASYSWAGSYHLAHHQDLIDSQWIQDYDTNNSLVGDVIFANWHNSNFSGIDHCAIITKNTRQYPYIWHAQHSPDVHICTFGLGPKGARRILLDRRPLYGVNRFGRFVWCWFASS